MHDDKGVYAPKYDLEGFNKWITRLSVWGLAQTLERIGPKRGNAVALSSFIRLLPNVSELDVNFLCNHDKYEPLPHPMLLRGPLSYISSPDCTLSRFTLSLNI